MNKQFKNELIIGFSSGLIFVLIYYFGKNFIISLICSIISYLLIRVVLNHYLKKETILSDFTFEKQDNRVIIKDLKEQATKINTIYQMIFIEKTNVNDSSSNDELKQKIETLLKSLNVLFTYYEEIKENDKFIQSLPMYLNSVLKVLHNYQTILTYDTNNKKTDSFVAEVNAFITNINNAIRKELSDYVEDQIFDTNIEMKQILAVLNNQNSSMLDINAYISQEAVNHEK